MRDQFGEQRVVVHGDRLAFDARRHRRERRRRRLAVAKQLAGLRQQPPRILGVDSALDRVAPRHDVVLREGKRLAAGHEQLRPHQIETGDRLGHRMLDLQPHVHFEKVERRRVAVARQQELDGSRVHVPGGSRRGERRGRQPLAHGRREGRRRRFFDHLLMAALQRAVPLEQMHEPAVAVAEDLHFDVARPLDQPLDVQRAVAERRARLHAAPRRSHPRRRSPSRTSAHAFAAAAAGRLEQRGEADLRDGRRDVGVVLRRPASRRARPGRRRRHRARARPSSIPCGA